MCCNNENLIFIFRDEKTDFYDIVILTFLAEDIMHNYSKRHFYKCLACFFPHFSSSNIYIFMLKLSLLLKLKRPEKRNTLENCYVRNQKSLLSIVWPFEIQTDLHNLLQKFSYASQLSIKYWSIRQWKFGKRVCWYLVECFVSHTKNRVAKEREEGRKGEREDGRFWL